MIVALKKPAVPMETAVPQDRNVIVKIASVLPFKQTIAVIRNNVAPLGIAVSLDKNVRVLNVLHSIKLFPKNVV